MPIKISTIIASNIVVEKDTSPSLGGPLDTNDFPIENGGASVTITGNKYPVVNGPVGTVLTSDGAGNVIFSATSLPGLYRENPVAPVTPVAAGSNSIALGSAATTTVNATNSLAIGEQSLARIPGGVVQASGRFALLGDAQSGRYLVRTNTINNVPTELFINGTAGNQRLILQDNSTWTFKITVTAHRTDVGDGHAGYTATGVIFRNSGSSTTSIQGSVQKTVLAESNPSWDINISADTASGALRITALGEAGKTIRWVALVETVEITN